MKTDYPRAWERKVTLEVGKEETYLAKKVKKVKKKKKNQTQTYTLQLYL